MAILIGFIIGAGVGFLLSAFFIIPGAVLNIRLVALAIGDILRIIGAVVVVFVGGIIGGYIGSRFANEYNAGRKE
jgi:uncharacterized membrane protein SpoIIM required for sporulation